MRLVLQVLGKLQTEFSCCCRKGGVAKEIGLYSQELEADKRPREKTIVSAFFILQP
jgi:hypothetical protein